ncbi:hypothetical protein pb186bvf_006819 [Paramecium bursaria]
MKKKQFVLKKNKKKQKKIIQNFELCFQQNTFVVSKIFDKKIQKTKSKNKQKQIMQQTQPPKQAQIYIENLDQGISEDYLYRKFKDVGEIQSLRITKDKTTQKSRGQAYIVFSHQDSADEARKRFNNQVFIKNQIRVKPYFNYHTADKKANIFINNLPDNADPLELEQEFSQYGNVLSLDIHRDSNGKSLNYGYVQFEKREEVEKLISSNVTINYKNKILKLEQFKAQTERKTESSAIYLRAFARPLANNEIEEKFQRAIEHAWALIIKDNLQNDDVADCFVKIDSANRQPWAMIKFQSPEQAKINLDICEKERTHPCIKSSAFKAFELIKKHGPPSNSDGAPQFKIEEVAAFFDSLTRDPNDPFKGESDKFFFNQVYSKHLNPDDRLILVQNINEDVTKQELEEFLAQFGKIIRFTMKTTKNPRFHVKQCFVHYQTLEDSKRARSEIYDDNNLALVDQKKRIFKEGRVMTNILLSKAVRKEYKEIKKQQNANIFQNPQGKPLLQPQYNQILPPPPFPGPMPNMPMGPMPNMPMQMPGPGQRPVFPPNMRPFPNNNQFQRPQMQGQGKRPYNPQYPPQNMGQGQRPYQQPYRNNFIPPPQQSQAPYVQSQQKRFGDYSQIQKNTTEFGQLTPKEQRETLGNLLLTKIMSLLPQFTQQQNKQIVGMLIDEQQFEISEIINFFEDEQELNDRIQEAIGIMNESQP